MGLSVRRLTDTPQGLKPYGFSVHRPSHRRDSPKALSAPLNISGRVLIAVHHQSAVGADMGAHAKALLCALTAAATVLARIRRRHRFHSLAGACCLESENGQEVAPSGIVNAFVEARLRRGSGMDIAPVPIPDGGAPAAVITGLNSPLYDLVCLPSP